MSVVHANRRCFAALRAAPVARGCIRCAASGSQWLSGARKSSRVGIIGSMKTHLSSRSSLKVVPARQVGNVCFACNILPPDVEV